MSVDQKKILIRQGNKADLVVTSLQPGEPVLALDTNEVGVKTNGGGMLWFATAGAGANTAALASEKGQPNGVPQLDKNGNVMQDPASYGKTKGGAVLPDVLPASPVIPKMGPDGKLSTATFADFAPGIQSGSNENGTFIKFPDGTMICTTFVHGTANYNTPWGSLYDVTIPIGKVWAGGSFASDPYVSAIETHITGVGADASFVEWVTYDKDKITDMAIARALSTTNPYNFSVIAIGRWK